MPALRCVRFIRSLFTCVPVVLSRSRATVDSGRDPPSAITRHDTQTTTLAHSESLVGWMAVGGALGGCCRIILRMANRGVTRVSGRDFPLCHLIIPKRFHLDPPYRLSLFHSNIGAETGVIWVSTGVLISPSAVEPGR